MAPSRSEVEALVQLLEDPDEQVHSAVRARLQELGRPALPALRSARDQVDPPIDQELDRLVRDIHLGGVIDAWHVLMDAENADLERGVFLLALYRYPTVDISSYQDTLDAFANEVRPRVEKGSGAERALVLADYLTESLGFRGNREHYYDPANSYLNRVLDRKRGIPISLAVVYLLLADRLDVPVCGVDMPVHFLVKYPKTGDDLYLDLFNGGDVVSKESCVRFLLEAGIRPRPAFFRCASARTILLRMVRNLLGIAEEANRKQTVKELMRLIAPWDPHLEWDDGRDGS